MNIYDLVIVFENYFLVKMLELFIPEIESNHFISFMLTILLTLESFVLSYINIGEHIELLFPILTLFVYVLIYNRHRVLVNALKVLAIFVNMTFIKIIVIMISSIIVGNNFQSFCNDYLTMFFLTCISIMTLGVEYLFLKNHYNSYYQLSKYSLFVLGICSIVTFIMVNIILKSYVNMRISVTLSISLVFAFMFFLCLVISLCVLNARYYEKNLEQSLKLESYDYEDKYIKAITERTVQYNKLRHDMKNHFNILERMIESSHIQEAKDYMEQISFDQGEHCVHINHLVLNYILSSKSELAKSHGIELSCIIMGEPVTFVSNVDYSILIGNLLDNAIEGTIEAGETEISLCLSFDVDKFIIEVKNCVIDKLKSKQFLTTKKDKSKHGIGLKNIKDIVDKYNGQDVIEVNGNVFYHMCILYRVDEK